VTPLVTNCSTITVARAGTCADVPIFHNLPLAATPQPTRAVVVIHGSGRNARGYFRSMRRIAGAADQAGRPDHPSQADHTGQPDQIDQTMVLAPWFKTRHDNPGGTDAVWRNGSWKRGGGARNPRGLSTFAVVDQILTMLGDRSRFPNLRRVTIAGHSAGGQLTQRYAAFGTAPNELPGLAVNYVVANPSSFLYFTNVRPSADGRFVVPSLAGLCPDFDTYKYGMAGRSGYAAAMTPDEALRTYVSRDVTLLSGEDDIVDDGNVDTSCAALLQGPNRAARAVNYAAYIQAIAPGARHRLIVLSGIAHDRRAIFTSPLAWPALFGTQRTEAETSLAAS
jgi:pimeloyl-ACP methyl ester carboxylesterase